MIFQDINQTKQASKTKSKVSRYIDRFLIFLIFINAVAIIIASMGASQGADEVQATGIEALFSQLSGGCLAVLGITLIAIPIGLLASGFSKSVTGSKD